MKKHERDLNAKNLFFHFFCQWKWILIAAVIGLALFGGYSMFKSYKDTPNVTAEKRLAELKAECSEEEIDEVSLAQEVRYKKEQVILDQEDYLNNSILMKLEPENVNKGISLYYVSVPASEDKTASNRAQAIITGICSRLSSDDTCEAIKERLGIQTENLYIRELFSFEGGQNDSIKLIVRAETPEQVDAVEEVVQSLLDAAVQDLQDSYGGFEVLLVDNQIQTLNDTDLALRQQELLDSVSAKKKELTEMDGTSLGLTGKALKYYDALGAYERDSSSLATNVSLTSRLSVKWLLIGAFVGVFIVFLICFLKSVFADYVRVSEDLRSFSEIPVLGEIYDLSREKKCVRWVFRLFYRRKFSADVQKQVSYAAAQIIGYTKKCDVSCVYLAVMDDCINDVNVQSVESELAAGGVTSAGKGNIIDDPDSLKMAIETGNCVLVMRQDVSRISEVEQAIRVCSGQKIDIVGGILLN